MIIVYTKLPPDHAERDHSPLFAPSAGVLQWAIQ